MRRPLHRPMLLVLALGIAGCGMGILPGDPLMPAGSREWIITVDNQSDQEARLLVAKDTTPVDEVVGRADPAVVPPLTKMEVRFTVPPGSGWAIFLNPTDERGPLLVATDAPADAVGRLPVSLGLDSNGEPYLMMSGDLPGWMGN